MDLPPPDITSTQVPIDQLDGTARSIARAATTAGYTLRATRALGPRTPRQPSQPVERIGTLAIVGVKDRWRFIATWNIRDGWDVIQHRPGWPVTTSNILQLRATLKAQADTTDHGPQAA